MTACYRLTVMCR